MHNRNLHLWQHDHAFAQDQKRPGEARTLLVIALTGTMMVVEIVAGVAFGSMALLADGLHMASHAAALGIAAFAYIYARRHARDDRFSFGTGKVNALGGFAGAVLLAGFALLMAAESLQRLVSPVAIVFDQAILVAFLGLLVNGLSAGILGHQHPLEEIEEESDPDAEHAHPNHDHNLRAAYLHVLADALTSLLAIFALLAGKYWGLVAMDPLMGLIGAVLVARWSWGLLRLTSAVLLDQQGPEGLRQAIRGHLEAHDDNRVADLHVWSVGPGIYAAIVAVVTHDPKAPNHYKQLLPPGLGLVHVTIEVHRCFEDPSAVAAAHAVREQTVRVADGAGLGASAPSDG